MSVRTESPVPHPALAPAKGTPVEVMTRRVRVVRDDVEHTVIDGVRMALDGAHASALLRLMRNTRIQLGPENTVILEALERSEAARR